MSDELSAPMKLLLEKLRIEGPVSVVDGDPIPFDEGVLEHATKLKYVHVDGGGGWSTIVTYSLAKAGKAALES